MKRRSITKRVTVKPKPRTPCFSSGCTVLDSVLGGGWAINRIANLVGDKSTGKTLLAIEAAANFRKKFPQGSIFYNEAEAAFDVEYAESLGLPTEDIVLLEDCRTIEDTYESLMSVIEASKNNHSLYILDSLDALASNAEMDRKFDATNTYGVEKARKLSELFRKLTKALAQSNVTVLIVSQVRDNIGVMFGDKHTRSGGRSLDFYSSQILWLAHIKRLDKTRLGSKRSFGVIIKAQAKKNKVGMPFRSCTFPIFFGYGVEDLVANLMFILEAKGNDRVGLTQAEVKKIIADPSTLDPVEYKRLLLKSKKEAKALWQEVEDKFLYKRKKYT